MSQDVENGECNVFNFEIYALPPIHSAVEIFQKVFSEFVVNLITQAKKRYDGRSIYLKFLLVP